MKQNKSKKFLNEKNLNITKQANAFKGYASSYNVEILNSFNPELQRKDTESTIKKKTNNFIDWIKTF